MASRRLHPTHLPISPPSPPTSHIRKRVTPAPVEDPIIHNSVNDFNWTTTYAQKQEELRFCIMLSGLLAFVVGLIILSFIVH